MIHTEQTFEEAIEQSLVDHGGYVKGNKNSFSKELALEPQTVIAFIKDTQPENWEKLKTIHGDQIESKLIARLVKELDLRGTLDVLRKGITDYAIKFYLAYFKPESSLNPDAEILYNKNILTVTRQVKYSQKNENSIDLLLSINGLPVATAELKNHFTNQNVEDAKQQYINDRDPGELLFQGKKRALVHFAVDSDEVYMTTKLDKKTTKFLPFNLGFNNGAGNPPNPNGYRTSYLWEYVWAKDSWMDIIGKFVHIQTTEYVLNDKKVKKESILFPRYHQLDVVRKVAEDARKNGVGKNYLIQHSAGSGKSNSIAWLAYRLSSLHNSENERTFHSVIVITDRTVLDSQLQDTIYQFEHKSGVVKKIDKNSAQLGEAIIAGSNIIITTLHKFQYILDQVKNLPSRRYAVIQDEAHSSAHGEASKKLKEVLAAKSLEEAETLDKETETDLEDEITQSMLSRGKQPNLSFFAFTATPKEKTLQVFGQKGTDGKPKAFHLYSMKQAIEENFIHDVLKGYTTYKTFFKLNKAIDEDPKFNKKKANRAIGRFVSLHPHNLAQKTEIIIEHFRQITSKKIGGKAKAMVVTCSRLHAVRYFLEFKKYIKEKGYSDVKPLVAFSGKVIDELNIEYTEPELNGFSESELRNRFGTDEYKVLLVAEKYQTGFDQPLLHTMYVDKIISGVKAVQTLSRLNRTCPGKEDTFVLDFANERDEILNSFQPYYELTTVEEETDPNLISDLKNKIESFQVIWQSEIDNFCKVLFKSKERIKDQKKLYAYTSPAVERFKALPTEEEKENFKHAVISYIRAYSFLSQIMPLLDVEMEKFYMFLKYFYNQLPKSGSGKNIHLSDEVALEYYRIQKMVEGNIVLESQSEYGLKGSKTPGMRGDKDIQAQLSEIIHILNEKFGTEFTEADKLFFDQIEAELVADETLSQQARNNSIENFKFGFEELFLKKVIERMELNEEIFTKLMDDGEFSGLVKEWMLKKVYRKLND